MSSPLSQTVLYFLFIFPWLCTFLCVTIKSSFKSLLLSFSTSVIIWYSWVIVSTEILSAFQILTRLGIWITWGLLVIPELLFLIYSKGTLVQSLKKFPQIIRGFYCLLKDDVLAFFLIFVITIILIKSTILALTVVPYNWDSMTYHLSRVMFWIEHKSVDFYSTNVLRQLWISGFPEYIHLHEILFTNGDFFVNMVQNWAAYGCVIISFFLMYKELKCSLRFSCIGTLIIITMNEFFVEATSTQTDILAAFIMLNIISILLCVNKQEHMEITKQYIILFSVLGMGCGVMFGVKSNSLVSILILAILVFASRVIKRDNLKNLFLYLLITVFSAIVIILPTLIRNYTYFGNFLALQYTSTVGIGSYNPRYMIINCIKNISSAASSKRNLTFLSKLVCKIALFLGVDVNALEISFGGTEYSLVYSYYMDSASAHIAMYIIILATIIAVYRLIRFHSSKDVFPLALLLQCYITFILVRWQPWVVRLLIPSLVLSVIPSIYYFELILCECKKKHNRYLVSSLFTFVIITICLGVHSESFSYCSGYRVGVMEDRFERYFAARGNVEEYSKFCSLIEDKKIDTIGLYTGEDSYQYPLLAKYYNSKKIENVSLIEKTENYSNDKYTLTFLPEAIVVANIDLRDNSIYYWNGVAYTCQYMSGDYSFWTKE